ncbi:MAG: DUF4091 domain-containing protein [Clostridia bacterium]|nr:DUF4091 domain-containing protein [Clostridia bacterium]
MMERLEIRNISSLEKIMPEMQCAATMIHTASALMGEDFSYQIAFKIRETMQGTKELQLEVCSDLADCISLYNVRHVPVLTPCYWDDHDENYITDRPGLLPDVLEPYTDFTMASSHMYRTVWVSVKPDACITPGTHTITILFKDGEEVWGTSSFELEVIAAQLPKSDIPYTNWFHCDCIASYHGCEVFSERHWELIDQYMKLAAENGINMILTPVFTPALDTKVGAERPTVQLMDITYDNGVYTFGFERLSRWLELCRKNGIEYLEISHLYSQWGAERTPKILVTENGQAVKKFGWQTDALSNEYKDFLRQMIPALKAYLSQNWDAEKVYFHISDEPNGDHIEHYSKLYAFVKPLLGEFKQMDAISHYEYYEHGGIETPVVATDAINKFLDKGVENTWAYYCCGHGKWNLSNRFYAMPSYRNRILGVQLYKYDIKGFLQWGYNFYYSRLSTHLINPYITNDAEGGFPAGDAFCVYPVQNGAIPSIRLKVFHQALQDRMALKLLESYVGKSEVMKVVEKLGEIDFRTYPANADYILSMRETINAMIKRAVG